MKKVTHLFLMLITVMAFTACAGSNAVSTNPGDMQGEWKLVKINDETVSADQEYILSFNKDGTVAGKTDCLYFAGRYSAQKEGQMSIDKLSNTKSLCGSSESTDFVEAIKNSAAFEVRDGQINLTEGDESELGVMEGPSLTLRTADGSLLFNQYKKTNES